MIFLAIRYQMNSGWPVSTSFANSGYVISLILCFWFFFWMRYIYLKGWALGFLSWLIILCHSTPVFWRHEVRLTWGSDGITWVTVFCMFLWRYTSSRDIFPLRFSQWGNSVIFSVNISVYNSFALYMYAYHHITMQLILSLLVHDFMLLVFLSDAVYLLERLGWCFLSWLIILCHFMSAFWRHELRLM